MKMKAKNIVLSRGLPKTGQTGSYNPGDDGDVEAGWWVGKKIANNKTRFIEKTLDGDDVVIDRATGLMWPKDNSLAGGRSNSATGWISQIIYANGLDFAGFTDWRMPNINELISIINWSQFNPAISNPPFINTISALLWSSTKHTDLIHYFWCLGASEGKIEYYDRNDLHRIKCVRGGL